MPVLFYYPKINAPRSVIDQALLYWDSLATVAPAGRPESFLDHRMRQVHEAGLYTRLEANRWPRPPHLERTLLLLTRLLGQIPPDDLIPEGGPDSYLHRAKLSSELLDELGRRGLTRDLDAGFGGVEVSAAVQLCLISTAARDIAGVTKGRGQGALYPHTDSLAAHRFAHSPISSVPEDDLPVGHPWPRESEPWLEVEIGGLLPVPNHEVAIQDLIAFRERYNDERQRLITAVDRLVRDLRQHHDHPRDVLHAVRRELEEALADLEQAGRSARMTWRRRSLTITTALAAAYAGQKTYPEAGWLLGVISGTAINIATSTTRPSGFRKENDVSYLHRVRSALA